MHVCADTFCARPSRKSVTWTALPDGQSFPGYTFNPWEGCERVSEGWRATVSWP
jgi:hypothetical protein